MGRCHTDVNRKRSSSNGNGVIAAERRRLILHHVLVNGAVNVAELAEAYSVGQETIRRDLDKLDSEGKIIRSHGGAIAREHGLERIPYSQVRREHLTEKSLIGGAALAFLPATGKAFLGAGSTVFQLAARIPEGHQVHIVTSSPEIAMHLVTRQVRVGLLGGEVRPDTLATDGSLSDEATQMLLFDAALVGLAGLDLQHGLTAIDRPAALFERQVIERSSKVIALCDSSKMGRSSYAAIGPIGLLDVIITDQGIDDEIAAEIRDLGVELVIAGPDGSVGGNDHSGL